MRPQIFQETQLDDLTAQLSKSEERISIILLGTALTLLLLMLGIKFPNIVEKINNEVTAVQIRLLPETSLSRLPVIVEVDEKSLVEYGQWPWPRYQVARLLEAIQRSGALSVAIDAVFIERDRTSPLEIQHVAERDFGQSFSLKGIDKTLWDYDITLGESLKSGPFILSYFFSNDNPYQASCQPKSVGGAWFSADGDKQSLLVQAPQNVVCNIDVLQQAAKYSGFINSKVDADGLYRKSPLIIEYKSRLYPSLALQAFLSAKKIDHFLVSAKKSGLTLQAGKIQIPLDHAGNLLIRFPSSEQTFEKISAADVLSNKIGTSRLKDRIVIVGFSATGLHEVRPTPYAPQFLGVEVHASIIDNLSRQDFLHRPDYANGLELFLATTLGLVLFITLAGAGPITLTIAHCLIIALLFAGSQSLLFLSGMVVSPALPVIMALATFLTLSLIKYSLESLHTKRMNSMVAKTQEGIIQSFSSMSEFRDPETGAHIRRTQNYVKVLATHLQQHPKFQTELTDDIIELFFKAAPLHDIGKISIRDNILLKPGHLEIDEFEIMKSHPQIGADIIAAVAAQSGWNPFMWIAQQICLSHHEKWDGSGYPKGLVGEEIPLSARLMMLADVYDALISKRVYKPAYSHNKAKSIILKGKNNHFDPLVVEAFVAIENQFLAIALQFLDSDDQRQTLLSQDK